jgi:hypothetical protein
MSQVIANNNNNMNGINVSADTSREFDTIVGDATKYASLILNNEPLTCKSTNDLNFYLYDVLKNNNNNFINVLNNIGDTHIKNLFIAHFLLCVQYAIENINDKSLIEQLLNVENMVTIINYIQDNDNNNKKAEEKPKNKKDNVEKRLDKITETFDEVTLAMFCESMKIIIMYVNTFEEHKEKIFSNAFNRVNVRCCFLKRTKFNVGVPSSVSENVVPFDKHNEHFKILANYSKEISKKISKMHDDLEYNKLTSVIENVLNNFETINIDTTVCAHFVQNMVCVIAHYISIDKQINFKQVAIFVNNILKKNNIDHVYDALNEKAIKWFIINTNIIIKHVKKDSACEALIAETGLTNFEEIQNDILKKKEDSKSATQTDGKGKGKGKGKGATQSDGKGKGKGKGKGNGKGATQSDGKGKGKGKGKGNGKGKGTGKGKGKSEGHGNEMGNTYSRGNGEADDEKE